MTLYDLRGKKLYAGDKEVQQAYFNGESLLPGGSLVPVEYTDSILAFNVEGGIVNYYKNPNNITLEYANNGQNIYTQTNTTGAGKSISFEDNALYATSAAVIVPHNIIDGSSGLYLEMTIQNIQPQPNFGGILYGSDPSMLSVYNYYTGATSQHGVRILSNWGSITTTTIPYSLITTNIYTLALVSDATETTVYLNGEQVATISGTLYTASHSKHNLFVLGGGTQYERIIDRATKTRIYDFKMGRTVPTPEQIMQNYQNIQDRLQNI